MLYHQNLSRKSLPDSRPKESSANDCSLHRHSLPDHRLHGRLGPSEAPLRAGQGGEHDGWHPPPRAPAHLHLRSRRQRREPAPDAEQSSKSATPRSTGSTAAATSPTTAPASSSATPSSTSTAGTKARAGSSTPSKTPLIEALATFGIRRRGLEGRPGVWVGNEKLAAIGLHISQGVTTHGFALNVDTDLSYFDHIVSCGLARRRRQLHRRLLRTARSTVDEADAAVIAALVTAPRPRRCASAPSRRCWRRCPQAEPPQTPGDGLLRPAIMACMEPDACSKHGPATCRPG